MSAITAETRHSEFTAANCLSLCGAINRCESVCRNRRHEEHVRLPRPVRHERGAGRGEGCPTIVSGLAVAERLLSPTLSSVPNGGEGAGRAAHFGEWRLAFRTAG